MMHATLLPSAGRPAKAGRGLPALVLFLALLCATAPVAAAKQPGQDRDLPPDMQAKAEAVCGKTGTFDCYTNHKYGYLIAWPKRLLTAQGESDAGDGQVFKAADDRAQLVCWAMFNDVAEQSLQQLYQEAQKESGLQVTYKHLGKDFFVVSGLLDGRIVYKKTVKNALVQATFLLTYDEAQKDAFNPLVGDIAKAFLVHPAFLAR